MRIGIDVDGVLADETEYLFQEGEKFFNKKIVNNDKQELDEIFKITKEEEHDFWKKKFKDYALNVKMIKDASLIVNELKKQNEIYIITARGYSKHSKYLTKEENMELLKDWLKNNNFSYDKIVLCDGSKVPAILKYNIDIMIDDSPKNIEEISKEIPVFCFSAKYNKDINLSNVTRIYSWENILEKINEKQLA